MTSMTVYPTKEGVTRLCADLREYRRLWHEAHEIRQQIEKLPAIEEELQRKYRLMFEALHGMGAAEKETTSCQNIVWILNELIEQVEG